MENTELLSLWKAYDKKLEESLILNRKNAEDITKLKVRSFLASMKPLKIFTLLVGLLWVIFVDTLIINLFFIASPFFLVSAAIQVLLTKLAIGIYLYQLILIQQADFNDPVVVTQEKLARLKSSTLWVTRLLFLQLPVWTTFYWTQSMFAPENVVLYSVSIVITALFTYASLWLFINIRQDNSNKKWFRLLFEGKEWTPVIRSMELLSQIDDFRSESKTTT